MTDELFYKNSQFLKVYQNNGLIFYNFLGVMQTALAIIAKKKASP